MGRSNRAPQGGLVYHVLNRANARITIFEDDADYEAFEQILKQAVDPEQWFLTPFSSLIVPVPAIIRTSGSPIEMTGTASRHNPAT